MKYAKSACDALAEQVDREFASRDVAEGFTAFLIEFAMSYAQQLSSPPTQL